MVESEVVVHDELVNHLHVTCVPWVLLIELWSSCPNLRKVVPRNAGEVMVLDVVADVQPEEIHRPSIVIGFHLADILVVLREVVECSWMRAI